MTNKNCLEGIRCPQCGHEDAFRIEAQITVYVTDDGTEDEGGHYAWDGESPCRCAECGHAGKLEDFRIQNQSAKQEARIRDAAPDLLAALEKTSEILSDMATYLEGCRDEPEVEANHAIIEARRAIAKATGGAS
jgi:Zn ribbon nucleic-acid-binding protein